MTWSPIEKERGWLSKHSNKVEAVAPRASIYTLYAIRACMEYGVWLEPRMELYGLHNLYIDYLLRITT